MRGVLHGVALGVASAGLGMVLLACGAPAPTESSETGWTVEACSNEDVDAALGELEGAGGQIVGFVVFAARTDRPCTLTGTAELRLIDADGRVLAEAPERAPAAGDPVVVLAPGSGLPDPDGARGGQGSFEFLFGDVCEPLPEGQGRIEVRLPGESEALVFPTDIRALGCAVPGDPAFLAVRPFASPIPE
jgi:hypothetical protein